MFKFAANLSLLFQEHAFLDRFAVAAASGFTAVEYHFPYAFAADCLRLELTRNGLTQVLFNLPAGDWEAGDGESPAIQAAGRSFAQYDIYHMQIMEGDLARTI